MCADAEAALQPLEADLARAEAQHSAALSEHRLVLQTTSELDLQVQVIEVELGSLRDGYLQASSEVGEVSKRELAEIKHFVSRPPEQIRCLLEATWILLNTANFQKTRTVKFDWARDWPRCQRMLADGNFIQRICEFRLPDLDLVPAVPQYIAAHYFAEGAPTAAAHSGARRHGSNATAASLVSRPTSRTRSSSSSPGPPKRSPVNLAVDEMSYASQPCAALLRWVQALVRGHMRLTELQQQRGALEERLMATREEELRVQERVRGAQAAVDIARQALASRTIELQEMEQALQEKQEADKRRRDAFFNTSVSTPLLDALKEMKKTDPSFVKEHNADWRASLDAKTENEIVDHLQVLPEGTGTIE